MAISDQEQKSILVPQHKRMAMGAPIDGKTLENKTAKPTTGGLASTKKK